MALRIATLLYLCAAVVGFTAVTPRTGTPQNRVPTALFSSTAESAAISVDPKEAVKLFGRLADKYILLDSSGE